MVGFVFDSISIAFSLWWIYFPPVLLVALIIAFEQLNRISYLAAQKWVLLELKVPQDIHKSPKSIEHVFAALHVVTAKPKWRERFFKGKVGDWFSFEIVSVSGEIHIFIRTLQDYRNLVEAQIYAQYPEAEIREVEDYVNNLPPPSRDGQPDLSGGEFILDKPDAYPIRTYVEFEEEKPGKDDVRRIDPLASLFEFMGTLQYGEILAVQLLITPKGSDWAKEAQKEVDKLTGKKEGVVEEKDQFSLFRLTPGKQEVVKAVERSLTKLGFTTNIRFIYIAPKEIFAGKARVGGVVGTFKQFTSQSLNGFKSNNDASTLAEWKFEQIIIRPFKKRVAFRRKVKIFNRFKKRYFSAKKFILTTEELATVFHIPDVGVKTSELPRIEAKKGEAPTSLPIV